MHRILKYCTCNEKSYFKENNNFNISRYLLCFFVYTECPVLIITPLNIPKFMYRNK